jgi:hypothetical protein
MKKINKRMTYPKVLTWAFLRKFMHTLVQDFEVRDREDRIETFLAHYPKKYQQALACALSVAHWSPMEWELVFKEEAIYWNNCGLCNYFHNESEDDDGYAGDYCVNCPFTSCSALWHGVFRAVADENKERFDEYAEKMFKALCELYEIEYRDALRVYNDE